MKFDFEKVTATSFIRAADRGILIALGCLTVVVFGLDILFFGSKASEWYLVPLFILLGIGFRLLCITAGVMLESMKDRKDERRARFTWRMIFVGCVAACMISAVSFFVGGYEKKESKEDAIVSVESVSTTTADTQVAALQKQQADIRKDRDTNIATLQRSIDGIVNDGLDNDSAADPYRIDQNAERESARARIAEIDKTITGLISSKATTQTEAANDKADSKVKAATTWAVFSWFSGRTGAHEKDVADFGMLFIALLLETIVAFGPGAYYGIHRRFVSMIRKLKAQESEEAALLDAEIAQIEVRTAQAHAMAAQAREEEMSDALAGKRLAEQAEEDIKITLETAEIEQRIADAKAKLEAIRNPPPKSEPKPPLTPQQQAAENASKAADLAREAAKNVLKIPVGQWSGRADRIVQARAA